MTELEKNISLYFGIISSRDLQIISSFFKFSALKKGDYLFPPNHACDKLSFVQSGLLRMYAPVDGNEVTQWISNKGYFSTDLSSFVFDAPSRFIIQALVDTEIYSINKTDYKKIGELVPQWNEIEKIFILRCFTIIEERVFSHLSMSAEERYLSFFENNKELFNQVPLQYIASMLGMTPETFSRIRKKQLL